VDGSVNTQTKGLVRVVVGRPERETPGQGLVSASSRPEARAAVGVAIADLALHQEVLDLLERDLRVRVIGSAPDAERADRLVSAEAPDALILCPEVLRAGLRDDAPWTRDGEPDLLIVAEEMTVPVLRDAIDAGATGVFAWPEERGDLVPSVVRVSATRAAAERPRGTVVAVLGARGGVGATFVATHLAAAFADRGLRAALADLDEDFADLTAALGLGADRPTRTVEDLLPVAEELSPEHVDQALVDHARGFRVLLAPYAARPEAPRLAAVVRASTALLALANDVVVLHLPRSLGEVTASSVRIADRIVVVSSLDLFSLHRARRVVDALGLAETPGRCLVAINRPTRSVLRPADVEDLLAIRPSLTIRVDAAVPRMQDRGELLSRTARGAGRDVRRLAELLVPPGTERADG
jgi:pilus assembly protein CpaE